MYLWKDQWNYASTGGILQTGRYRGHYLRICGEASGIMPVLGKFLKLVGIEDITYVSVERPVEFLTYLWKGQWNSLRICGKASGIPYVSVERPVELCQYCGNSSNWYV